MLNDDFDRPLTIEELHMARMEAIAEEQLTHTRTIASGLRTLTWLLAFMFFVVAAKVWG